MSGVDRLTVAVAVSAVIVVVGGRVAPGTAVGLLALGHLGVLVGAPMARSFRTEVRSRAVLLVLAVAFSLALSFVAAQALIWFGEATRSLIVVTSTAYGLVLGALLETGNRGWSVGAGTEPESSPGLPVSLDRTALVVLGVLVTAVTLAVIGGRRTSHLDVDGLGIVSALPVLYWVGAAVAVGGTALALVVGGHGRPRLAAAIPVVWLLVLHAAPALAHERARFAQVYIHLGFIRLIDDLDTGNILLDARFAWPGFFGAFVPSLTMMDEGWVDLVMRLWPTVMVGTWSVLVAALARRAYPAIPLIGPISALVFVFLSWTGQGYFSPQGVGVLFYLAALVVIESGPLRLRGAWSSVAPILSRFATAGGDRPTAGSAGSSMAILLLVLAAVVSHPLTPFFVLASLVVLALYGRTVVWRLMVTAAVGYVVWFLVAAQPWWQPRLEQLLAQFGNFASNFTSSTSERGAESSAQHALVIMIRARVGLATFLSVLVLGLAFATDRFRHLRPALPLAPLAGIPVAAAALQSYGGEIIIRVLLFTLPMAAILLARAILALPSRSLPVAVPALVVLMLPVFLIARFGNESYEMVTEADIAASDVAYEAVTPGTVYLVPNDFMAFGHRLRDRNAFDLLPVPGASESLDEAWLASVRGRIRDNGGDRGVIVITPSQSAWLEHVTSAPTRSLDRVGVWLRGRSGVEVLHEGDGAWVIAVDA